LKNGCSLHKEPNIFLAIYYSKAIITLNFIKFKYMSSSITAVSVQIKVNSNLYLRDPQETKLGKKIIEYGIQLINWD